MADEETDVQTTDTTEPAANADGTPPAAVAETKQVEAAPETTREPDGGTPADSALTDEQVEEFISKDSRFRERIMASDDVKDGLDAAIDSILNEKEQTARTTEATRADQQTMASAVKSYNDGDKDALADYAIGYFRNQRQQEIADSAAESTSSVRMNEMLRAEYGPEIEALAKTNEYERLDRIQDAPTFYRETLKALNQMRSSAGDATTKDQVDEMSRAAASTATAAKARGDAVGVGSLPGGTATEGAEGMDPDALIREGLSGTPGLEDYGK